MSQQLAENGVLLQRLLQASTPINPPLPLAGKLLPIELCFSVFDNIAKRLGYSAQWGFPGGASRKEPACQHRRHRFDLWVGKIPWRRAWQPTPIFLPGEFHGQRNLAGHSP